MTKLVILLVVVVGLYVLSVIPNLSGKQRLRNFRGWHYAHRGLHHNGGDAPENSLKAFRHAVEHRYGIELDVQITKDGVPVVIHDYNLKRACGVDCKVADVPYIALKNYHLFSSKEHIPTLQEVLDCVNGKVPLIIELKIPYKPGPTCEAVSKVLENYKGNYCIESFNPLGLMWYRRKKPNIARGQLSTDFRKEKIEGNQFEYFLLKHMLFNFITRPDFIAYEHKYKKTLSFQICRKFYGVMTAAWTIRSEEQMKNGMDSFDLFIFENFLPPHPKGNKAHTDLRV